MIFQYDKSPKRGRRLVMGLVVAVVVAAGFLAFLFTDKAVAPTQQIMVSNQLIPKQTSTPKTISGRYLFNGTVAWARAVEQQARGDYNQPFSMLDSFSRSQYDAWMASLECPITKNTVPYQTQINDLIFNCRPEFLPAASKYFNIFDLANNHTDNQGGEKGLEETRQHLNAAGVQYFGTFDSADAQNVCEVLSLPIRIQKSDRTEQSSFTKASEDKKSALPVAFCGWHYFYRKPNAGEIDIMNKYAKIMPVFAFAEMGAEYKPKADDTQVAIAHQIIDAGPDFLIANNPHWVQNTEVYKGKLIVYSTGNFIFDQLDSETNRSASIDLSITVPYDDNVAKWLALAPTCAAFHDGCLAEAEKQGLTKLKLQLKYAIVAGQNGYKAITHKSDAATQSAVEQRTNWFETLKNLNQN